jgi:uncharacterized protein (DUF433 family)
VSELRGPLLGAGIYDVVDVAWLIRRDPSTVARWTSRRRGVRPFLVPSHGGLFSFHDLISLYVISELLERGVKRKAIIAGGDYMARKLGTDRPYAHEHQATVGAAFFAEIDNEWLDVGKGGQAAFPEIIEPLLQPIDFGTNGLAILWRPAPGVTLDPGVQSGTPCVEGTRVPTDLLSALLSQEAEESEIELLADDYQLSAEDVRLAVAYQRQAIGHAA